MKFRIYTYIILLSSLFFCQLAVFSQDKQDEKQEEKTEKEKLGIKGIKIEYDVASLVMSAFSNGVTYSTEGNIQVKLSSKLYPILEFGYAGANKTSRNDFGFTTNALFGRIGLDYNLLKQKENQTFINNKMFTVGGRVGLSNFKYDVTNIQLTDDYWGGSETLNFTDQHSTKVWVEIVAGMRVEVLKNFYLGWSIRNKIMIGKDKYGEVSPWYIPGYGKKAGGNWGFNYTVGYAF